MKLKNLLFATMFACAFASCSSDDDPVIDNGGGEETGDATLALKIETPKVTRSGDTEGKDDNIKKLDVYVFNGVESSAKLLIKQGVDADGSTEVTEIPVGAGRKSVVVVANATLETASYATLGALYSAEKEFSGEVNGLLSMNSKTYVVDIIPGRTNYLGYVEEEVKKEGGNYLVPVSGDLNDKPVKLYRNVAKINLHKISVKADEAKYVNSKFYPTDVFVLHGKNKTKVVGGADAWNSTEVKDGEKPWLVAPSTATYKDWVTTMTTWLEANPDKPVKKNYLSEDNDYIAEVSALAGKNGVFNGAIANNGSLTNEAGSLDYFYAYENTDVTTHTLLVVEGFFVYGEDQTDYTNKFPKRYYSISVGREGIGDGVITTPEGGIERDVRNNGVFRNLQYNIELGVQGPGWETPFGPDGNENTFMDVKVEVAQFGLVNQHVDIE